MRVSASSWKRVADLSVIKLEGLTPFIFSSAADASPDIQDGPLEFLLLLWATLVSTDR
jgi:hypothetical protein